MCLVTPEPLHNCGYCCKLRNLLKIHYSKVNSSQNVIQSGKYKSKLTTWQRSARFKRRKTNSQNKCPNKTIAISTHKDISNKAKTKFENFRYTLKNCSVPLVRTDQTKTKNYSAQKALTDTRCVVKLRMAISRSNEIVTQTRTSGIENPVVGIETQNSVRKTNDKTASNVAKHQDILKEFSQRIASRLNLGSRLTNQRTEIVRRHDCNICPYYTQCICLGQQVKSEPEKLDDFNALADQFDIESGTLNAEWVTLNERRNDEIAKDDKADVSGGGKACENDDSKADDFVTEHDDMHDDDDDVTCENEIPHNADDVTYDDEDENELVNEDSTCINMNKEKVPNNDESSEEKSFPCLICLTMSFPTEALLIRHKRKTHKEGGRAKCPHCTYFSQRFDVIERHIKCCHTGVLDTTPAPSAATYECPKCGKKFGSKEGLLRHERNTHSSHVYSCPHCTHQTKRKDHLKRHIKVQHSTKCAMKCVHCDFAARLHTQLYKHIRQAHWEKCRDRPPDDVYRCNVCDFTAASTAILSIHMTRKHRLEEIVLYKDEKVEAGTTYRQRYSNQCHECDKTFGTQDEIYMHMKAVHSDVRPYACDLCDYTCKQTSYLKKHQRIHIEGRSFQCTFCPYTSRWKDTVSKHIQKSHHQESQSTLSFACTVCQSETCIDPEHNVPVSVSVASDDTVVSSEDNDSASRNNEENTSAGAQSEQSSEQVTYNAKMSDNVIEYKCNLCPDTFVTAFERRLHANMHRENKLISKGRTYLCNLCDCSFRGLKVFIKHRASCHKHGNLHKCSHCDFSTRKGRFTLLEHMKEHGRDTAYCCDICGAQFEFENLFKVHMSQHRKSIKRFECSICYKKYFKKCFLTYHMRDSHGNVKSHLCSYCGSTFKSKCLFQLHMTSKHSDVKREFKCPHCDHMKVDITDHIRRAHPEKCVARPENGIYECKLCTFASSEHAGVKNHMRRIHGVKNVDVLERKDKFIQARPRVKTTKRFLERDPLTHPFECSEPDCFMRCKTKRFLKLHHTKWHSDERPFSCEYCDFLCQYLTQLKTHIKAKHKDVSLYSCPRCDFTAQFKRELTAHVQAEHPVEKKSKRRERKRKIKRQTDSPLYSYDTDCVPQMDATKDEEL